MRTIDSVATIFRQAGLTCKWERFGGFPVEFDRFPKQLSREDEFTAGHQISCETLTETGAWQVGITQKQQHVDLRDRVVKKYKLVQNPIPSRMSMKGQKYSSIREQVTL